MKNKQINKFLFMFVVGLSLLFSFSNADVITLDSTYEMADMLDYVAIKFNEVVLNEADSNMVLTILDYLKSNNLYDTEIYVYYIGHYKTNGTYHILRYEKSDSNKPWYINTHSSGSGYGMIYNFSTPYVSNVTLDTDGTFISCSDFSRHSTTYTMCFGLYTQSKTTPYYTLYTGYDIPSSYVYTYMPLYSSENWGRVYFYHSSAWHNGSEVVKNPVLSVSDDGPDFEGISDTEKATIINSIISSDDFSSVPQKYRNQFFIIKDKSTNGYNVYFYPEQYFLKGRIFEEGSTSDVSYKAYKIIAFEGSNFLWDLWQSISPFDYYVFSGYFNEDETFTSYFNNYKNSHEVNQYYFNYEEEPIVYTSRDIGFVIYNIDSNEYVDDTDNSISSTVLTDGDGNEITIEIPVNDSTVSDTPWNRFITLIQSIPEKLVSGFSNLTGLTKIVTIISPIGSAILIILNVLLSSISLLSRAVAFVYTLPTIKASDALFLADVDSTTGLVFTGNSWGTRFLEGLNMVKEFSWNGLNLWTLFTSFIVAIFAIYCVKLVRKHYHY